MLVFFVMVSQRYICGLQSALVSLGSFKVVFRVSFYVKYFNKVAVVSKHQPTKLK